jgi:pimeloyl-ACP methyl ester carboxylesterase
MKRNWLTITLLYALVIVACSSKKRIRDSNPPDEQFSPGGIHGGLVLKDADADCQTFLDKVLPQDVSRNVIDVPEDWSNPEGKKIQVFYYTKIEPNKPVVAFFNGGPNSSSHGFYNLLSQLEESKKFSFVFMDQRGTGCSTHYPEGKSQSEIQALEHYSSRSIVLDAEAIREKLLGPGSKWKIFGQSFGAHIVYRYLTIAPQSVVSAHAHGFSIMKDPAAWVSKRLRQQKDSLESYFDSYKVDKIYLQNMRAQIPANHCISSSTHEICGTTILDPLFLLLGFKTSWITMNKWISKMQSPDMILNYPKIDEFGTTYGLNWFFTNSVSQAVISRVDVNEGMSDPDLCKAAQKILEKENNDPSQWLINECRLYINVKEKFANLGNTEKVKADVLKTEDLKSALEKHLNVKLYIYSGGIDTLVPPSTFNEMTSELGKLVEYQNFPNSGHDGYRTEPQVWIDLDK